MAWISLRVMKKAITLSSKINTLTEFPVCRSFFNVEPESLKQWIRNGVCECISKTYFLKISFRKKKCTYDKRYHF